MFELLVVSSEDKWFNEWIKCFELLFDVTADQIMADYNELVPLVNVTTTPYIRTFDDYVDDDGNVYEYTDNYVDEPYNWITLSPNRNRFYKPNCSLKYYLIVKLS